MAKTYKEYAGEDAQFADAVRVVKQMRWPDPDHLMKELDIGYSRARQLADMVDEYFRDRNYFYDYDVVFNTSVKKIGDRFYDAKGNSILVSPSCELYDYLLDQTVKAGGELLGE